MDSERPTVGFLGLGRMGRLMATNLAGAGVPLTVYNRTTPVAEEFAATVGCGWATTPAEAAAAADVIITMLADGDALIEVLSGRGGALGALRAGAIVVDMGTSGPAAVARARSAVSEAGATMVDAPVSGSMPAAEAGGLLIMVGSASETFERIRSVLSAMGEPRLVGPPGAGAALKLAVNSILYGLNQALAEAVAVAEASGVPATTALDVIAASAAGAPLVTYRRQQYLEPDEAPVMFTLSLAAKDLRLAVELAAATGIPMEQAERTLEIVAELVDGGEGDRDMGFVVEATRRRSAGRLTGER
ncbi:MAG: NAD(P)-dependent oxidoreductase [Acidimicrobiales bacterium]